MFQALHREDNVSEKSSERIQTLSKNLPCEATTFILGTFISNTQGFQKILLSVLSVYFMAHYSDKKSSVVLQGYGSFVF